MSFGLEMLSAALNPKDRQWVPVMGKNQTPARFASEKDADAYALALMIQQPHLELKTVALEDPDRRYKWADR